MSQFEIEIKSLLGSKEKAGVLRKKIKKFFPNTKLKAKNSQLNHYFIGGNLKKLSQSLVKHLSAAKQKSLKKILTEGKNHSVRTRKLDDTVILVVKASIDDTTSSNGISRMEFESPVSISLDELDQLLLDANFSC
ncbi:hypothetical protein KKH46_03245, partial [Patescibacteria group bacterium]|nr:hypothetical protein [Patescibacteria group bacterium]